MSSSNPVIPVIMSGGSGSRLWPLSRQKYPKPFITFDDGFDLYQKTFLRATHIASHDEVLTVTNKEFLFKTIDDIEKLDVAAKASFILEPYGRNTAPALVMAALYLQEVYGNQAVFVALAADHLIEGDDSFCHAIQQAVGFAHDGRIVTFGITPTYPEVGYGYIQFEGNRVLSFVEKPSLDRAQDFVASGRYLWNSGMFCAEVGVFLSEMMKYKPEVYHEAETCFLASKRGSRQNGYATVTLDRELFKTVEDISVDYAVIEKTDKLAVVPCHFKWSDVGSWLSMSSLSQVDEDGNSFIGDVEAVNVRNCYIQSKNRLTGVVGVEDLVVVDTPDALLIAKKESSQDVKRLFSQLKVNWYGKFGQ